MPAYAALHGTWFILAEAEVKMIELGLFNFRFLKSELTNKRGAEKLRFVCCSTFLRDIRCGGQTTVVPDTIANPSTASILSGNSTRLSGDWKSIDTFQIRIVG